MGGKVGWEWEGDVQEREEGREGWAHNLSNIVEPSASWEWASLPPIGHWLPSYLNNIKHPKESKLRYTWT